MLVGLAVAAGHHGRAETRAFLTAGNTAADEQETLFLELLLAADGVGPLGVAAVDDDVAGFENLREGVDHRVGGLAGLHHDHRAARALEAGGEFLQRGMADEAAGSVRVFRHELLHGGGGAVVNRDAEAVVGDVEGEVLAHDREADESDVRELVLT